MYILLICMHLVYLIWTYLVQVGEERHHILDTTHTVRKVRFDAVFILVCTVLHCFLYCFMLLYGCFYTVVL